MSTFDSLFYNDQETEVSSSLDTFKELAIDYDTGEFLTENGDYIELEEGEALKVWIWKALKTTRNKYLYSSSFGNDLGDEIGYVYSRTVKQQLIYSEIQECLIVNPYISRVYDFSSELSNDSSKLTVTFSVETLYNVIEEVTNIYV